MDHEHEQPTRRVAIGTIVAGAGAALTFAPQTASAKAQSAEARAQPGDDARATGAPILQRGCL